VTPEQEKAIEDAKRIRDAAIAEAKKAKAAAYKDLAERQKAFWPFAEAEAANDVDRAEQVADLQNQIATLSETGRKAAETKLRKLIRPDHMRLMEAAGLDGGQATYERDQKAARAECGCFWGTYLTVEDAASKFHIGPPPRFKRWEGNGTIAVQLQGGLTVEDAIAGGDTRLRIALQNEERLAQKGDDSGLEARATIHMRIGTSGRDPVWAEFHATINRPLPRNGVIKWAYLHRERISYDHDKWRLRLAVEYSEDEGQPSRTGFASVHLGARTMPDGQIRIATIVDSDGTVEEISMPGKTDSRGRFHSLNEMLDKADSLQSIRDRRMNRRLPRLLAWLESHADTLPQWLKESTATIHSWSAQSRFVELCVKWRTNRFPGDELAFALFERWRKKEKHLADWEMFQRNNVVTIRKNAYRTLARRLAERYAFIVTPAVDYSELRLRPQVDDETILPTVARRNASVASPGLLSQFLKEAAAGRVVLIPAKHVTGECHACGQIDQWDRKRREHTCSKCGTRWDQDHNAARVALARGLALAKSPGPLDDQSGTRLTTEKDVPPDGSEASPTGAARKSRRNRRASRE